MKIKPQYTKAIVVVHGKSELQLVKFVRSNLRLKIEDYFDSKSSIQINDLDTLLNNNIFKNIKSFRKKYDDIEWDAKNKKFVDFKLFFIMDTDDCTEVQKNEYINGNKFKKHWLNEYIVPIYNSKDLEEAMESMGINVIKKRDYIKIFPTDIKYKQGKTDIMQIDELIKLSEKSKKTNIDSFLKYCLQCTYNKNR